MGAEICWGFWGKAPVIQQQEDLSLSPSCEYCYCYVQVLYLNCCNHLASPLRMMPTQKMVSEETKITWILIDIVALLNQPALKAA